MIGRILGVIAAPFALLLASPVALAEQADAVSLSGDVKVVRTVEENGATVTKLEEPTQVVPGDRILFRTAYRNTSGSTVEDFVITNPLPSAVVLAEPGDFEVSVNGGDAFASLSSLTVTLDDGTSRPAELADVTHIRWTLHHLAPGQSGTVTYFAVIR